MPESHGESGMLKFLREVFGTMKLISWFEVFGNAKTSRIS
jgi:hypothetical protein